MGEYHALSLLSTKIPNSCSIYLWADGGFSSGHKWGILGGRRGKLKESPEDTLLSHLAHLSQWFWFEEGLLESVRNVIEKIVLRGINEHEYEQRIRRLSDVGLIAAVHRDTKLAKVIGNFGLLDVV